MKKENIIILFGGAHLAYAPSVTQLYEALEEIGNVTIYAEYLEGFISQKVTDKNVIYFVEPEWKKPSYIKKIGYFFLRRFSTQAKRLEAAGMKLKVNYSSFSRLKKILKKGNYDRVIANDSLHLFYCSVLDIHTDFLSLELSIGEKLIPFVNKKTIDCVITQSKERFEYLLGDFKVKTFIIPNAPNYIENKTASTKYGLLYGGSAWDPFGFYNCLAYLRLYNDTPLTVQGAYPYGELEKIKTEYNDLIEQKLLILNEGFLKNEEVVNYFSNFEIGICFYNFEYEWIRHFNYHSAPSGKVFKYLAAGVPVIAIDILGFKFIEEMECGVLIPDLKPESIKAGIDKIRSNYALYAANTTIAARYFSFDKAVQPYINYIKENTKQT